jgi:hypothetical protein
MHVWSLTIAMLTVEAILLNGTLLNPQVVDVTWNEPHVRGYEGNYAQITIGVHKIAIDVHKMQRKFCIRRDDRS